ncbi:MAG: sugar nucleotide-binding protein, partial [Planctomycetota bacterium]
MKVLIFGAGGIIGQHLHLTVPHQVKTATFCRRKPDLLHVGVDANEPIPVAVDEVLVGHKPNVVINLAGENNPDAVERDPQAHQTVNEDLPRALANWCQENHATYIHTSTQAVFSGQEPPYGPHSPHAPVNQYGCQKAAVDQTLRHFRNTIIVRPTF